MPAPTLGIREAAGPGAPPECCKELNVTIPGVCRGEQEGRNATTLSHPGDRANRYESPSKLSRAHSRDRKVVPSRGLAAQQQSHKARWFHCGSRGLSRAGAASDRWGLGTQRGCSGKGARPSPGLAPPAACRLPARHLQTPAGSLSPCKVTCPLLSAFLHLRSHCSLGPHLSFCPCPAPRGCLLSL